MHLTPEQIAAYEKALYVVFAIPQLELRIGEPNPDLDALLEADGAKTAAYITAANPRGEPRGKDENEAAALALHESLTDSGYLCYGGEGRDPQGRWKPEPSFLVPGISQVQAAAIGKKFGQNAIVFVEMGRPPELVLLET
jgi:hypothetical protein